jgi:hypothetical protein
VPVVAVSSGAKVLAHEASIIATKERAEMKMIEFFIARKLSLTALGIQSQSAVSRKASHPATDFLVHSKPVGVWAGSQLSILRDERFGLWTRTATGSGS